MKTLATIITVFLLVNILSAQENTMPVQDSSKIKMTLTKSELKKAKLEEEKNHLQAIRARKLDQLVRSGVPDKYRIELQSRPI